MPGRHTKCLWLHFGDRNRLSFSIVRVLKFPLQVMTTQQCKSACRVDTRFVFLSLTLHLKTTTSYSLVGGFTKRTHKMTSQTSLMGITPSHTDPQKVGSHRIPSISEEDSPGIRMTLPPTHSPRHLPTTAGQLTAPLKITKNIEQQTSTSWSM